MEDGGWAELQSAASWREPVEDAGTELVCGTTDGGEKEIGTPAGGEFLPSSLADALCSFLPILWTRSTRR